MNSRLAFFFYFSVRFFVVLVVIMIITVSAIGACAIGFPGWTGGRAVGRPL